MYTKLLTDMYFMIKNISQPQNNSTEQQLLIIETNLYMS